MMVALVVGIGLLLGGNRPKISAETPSSTVQLVEQQVTDQQQPPLVESDLLSLEQENAQLKQAVDTLLQRESEYTTQIDLANQALAEQANATANSGSGVAYANGDDEYEQEPAHHYEEHEENDD